MACAPGLLPALERDLAAARVKQSRARLSQLELEKLCNWVPASAEPNEEGLEELETSLHALLAADPNWNLDRLTQSVAEKGLGETLNLLAFETELDLEPLRRLLPEYEHALRTDSLKVAPVQKQLSRGVAPTESGLPSAKAIHQALDQFDNDRFSVR